MASVVQSIDDMFIAVFSDLSPALMGGTFLAVLAALVLAKYIVAITDIVSIISVPKTIMGSTKVSGLLSAILGLLMSILVIGVVYAFVISPILNSSFLQAANTANNGNRMNQDDE